MIPLTLAQLAAKVEGMRCLSATNPLGSAIRLVFDSGDTPSDRSWRVVLEDGWRWSRAAEVLANSVTEGGRNGTLRQAVAPMVGLAVVATASDAYTGGLWFRFDDGSVLETDHTAGDPEWLLVAGDGTSARFSRDEGLMIDEGDD